MSNSTDRTIAAALKIGATEQQARELAAFLAAESGTLTVTANTIVTHPSGKRHWSHLPCEECA